MKKLQKTFNKFFDIAVEVVKVIKQNGYQAYFAGGCVRDELLNLIPKDYDIATNAPPEKVSSFFNKTIDLSSKFGVTIVVIDHVNIEVTTFRKEFEYYDGRHPSKIEFGQLKDDFKRRDFTVNALYKDIEKNEIIDFTDGVKDLENKIIRCVGNPKIRLLEDKLRLLRAVRFAAKLNFTIEEKTFKTIKDNAEKILEVSNERIKEELIKIFTLENAEYGLELLDKTGLLKIILPEIEKLKGVEQPPQFHPEGDVFEHTKLALKYLEKKNNYILSFATLFHDVGKPDSMKITDRIRFNGHNKLGAEITENILKRLRFSNKDIKAIKQLVYNHMKFMDVQKMKNSTLKKLIFNRYFKLELLLHKADCMSSHSKLDNYNFLLKKIDEFKQIKQLPGKMIKGRDLIKLNLIKGPIYKKIINDVYEKQLNNEFNSKAESVEYVKKKYSDYIMD